MSFSGTPLGQGRRLDHNTFLGKPPSNGTVPPPSYAYGAPALGSRSPPKPTSPTRDRSRVLDSNHLPHEDNEPALQRFARLKQRESAAELNSRPGGPKITTSPLRPDKDKWTYKDTTVNIANAFEQAANRADMSSSYTNPHNISWASSRADKAPLPRSTSEEYENTVTHASKRLAPPPDKLGRAPTTTRKPPSKSNSLLHVPDSEDEGNSSLLSGRAKSPLQQGVLYARQALGAAAFYVRQHSREPENTSNDQSPPNPKNGATNGNDSSYDYAAEEQEFQSQKRNQATQRRNRISVDNKAYKPSQSDEEESEYSDDGKKRKRRKSKKGPVGGPLTTLPVVGADKRRRRKGQGSKTNPGDESESESDENTQMEQEPQSAPQRASVSRMSNPPVLRVQQYEEDDYTMSKQGLDSIPEVDESALPQEHARRQPSQQRRTRSRTPVPPPIQTPFSIGGLLGSLVRVIISLCVWVFSGTLSLLSMSTFLSGQVFGATFDLLLRRPIGWARSGSHLVKYMIPGLIMASAWYMLQNAPISSYIPTLSFPSQAPPIAPPPSNVADLANRILRLDNLMYEISTELKGIKTKVEDNSRKQSDILGSMSISEDRLSTRVKNVADADARAREDVTNTIRSVQHQVEVLQSQLVVQQKLYEKEKDQKTGTVGSDEEARAQIKSLEEKIESVQGGLKEALEIGKKAIAAAPASAPAGAAWWNKLGSKSTLQIKSADGQDVTGLVTQMVDSAISRVNKDVVAKADYAMYSGGAVIIPRLTSPVLEIKQRSLSGQILSLFSGSPKRVGRSPTVALHPDINNGQCWPFQGDQGRLGVALAYPIYPEEFTIDHVPKELAYEMIAAPKDMEVWGLVEGRDNEERVKAWKEERIARKEAGFEPSVHDDIEYPSDLPKHPEFLRLAKFSYDINAPNNVQTFPVDPEIKELGVDFGIVVLRILNNWGRDGYTCLYRFRAHGQRLSQDVPPPLTEQS